MLGDTTDEVELARLTAEYGGFWAVWRSTDERGNPAAWCASKRRGAPAAWTPTLHETTPAALETQLKSPPKRIGAELSHVRGLTR